MLNLRRKRVWIFDWDGTLLDSMEIKRETFAEVLLRHLSPRAPTLTRDFIAERYSTYGGLPRLAIFDAIAADCGATLTDADREGMSRELSDLNERALSAATLHPDAERLLAMLATMDVEIFISSSVPPEELRRLVDAKLARPIRERVRGTFGSAPGFSKGPEHLERIRATVDCAEDDCVMFGDDPADIALASAGGVEGILIDRESRYPGHSPPTIRSLDKVSACLR